MDNEKRMSLSGFIEKFKEQFPRFQQLAAQESANWAPDEISDFLLVSSFGGALGFEIDSFDDLEKARLFALIEAGVCSEDESTSTAIATGLLEAMVSRSFQFPEKWEMVKSLMGPESIRYVTAWLEADFSFPESSK
ncbi:MAG: hypothetical protein IPO40_19210 [Fibrobacteres bacterium]|nr:hypothetical protein [Fibrobacterota bacterium]